MCEIETRDGLALIGYAGLGATSRGTEPADWMSGVLRGQQLAIEQSLGTIADAIEEQFPAHMARVPKWEDLPSHHVVAAAFVEGEPRLYTIVLASSEDRRTWRLDYRRIAAEYAGGTIKRPPRLAVTGSGGDVLFKNRGWVGNLLRLVAGHERGRLSAEAVADQLAKLNEDTSNQVAGRTVGRRCIVAWRYRKEGRFGGGGGHQFYTGTSRDADSPALPTLVQGMDLRAMMDVLMPISMKSFEAIERGPELPEEVILMQANRLLAAVPQTPNRELI